MPDEEYSHNPIFVDPYNRDPSYQPYPPEYEFAGYQNPLLYDLFLAAGRQGEKMGLGSVGATGAGAQELVDFLKKHVYDKQAPSVDREGRAGMVPPTTDKLNDDYNMQLAMTRGTMDDFKRDFVQGLMMQMMGER